MLLLCVITTKSVLIIFHHQSIFLIDCQMNSKDKYDNDDDDMNVESNDSQANLKNVDDKDDKDDG